MSQRRTASRTDWEIEPIPDAHARIRLDREFSPDEIALIRHGQSAGVEVQVSGAEIRGSRAGDVIAPIREILDAAGTEGTPEAVTLRHALNERWFSDSLAWLLDPRGLHGLGDGFLRHVVRTIAQRRSGVGSGYARRASHLKWGKGRGRDGTRRG